MKKIKKKKILVMGLPGSGKSYLCARLCKVIDAKWINADQVRKDANDWDFSPQGRIRQSNRMRKFSEKAINEGKHALADFVCPTNKTRTDFKADFVIWMNTISKGRFKDTNKIFQPPKKNNVDFIVTEKNADLYKFLIADKIDKYIWNNKKPTAQMLGRWQPWHAGHKKLFEQIIKKTGQVNIMVRDVKGVGDNPFKFQIVKKNINQALKDFKNRIKITLVPNLTNICYGRDVGYKIQQIVLDKKTQKISATKIRQIMKKKGLI